MTPVEVPEEYAGERVDKFLCHVLPDYSRTDLQGLLEAGQVLCDGHVCAKNLRLRSGMRLTILQLPTKASSHLEPEEIPLDIVFEDKDLVILNKPRNLVVHPGNGVQSGTLAAGLLYHFKKLSSINGPLRPGIVHRLDKDTPGLMVVARNDKAHRTLAEMLEARKIERIYQALVWGHPDDAEGIVDAPIGRDPDNRVRMAVQPTGKRAVTHYRVLESFRFATLVECKLDTGRTHQIRVHMRHLGHPIVGDPAYEGAECALQRLGPLDRPAAAKLLKIAPAQLLQAVRLSLPHPRTQKPLQFSVPLDAAFSEALDLLRG
ncbi:MAG TPA: RluA family pseudouridine synthase [Fibrobacteraceae bacterium]|nr:RluA family pseudouridine synthase [Fibrobacteraceae bacterium]